MTKEMTIEEAIEELEPLVKGVFLRDYEKQSLKRLIQHAKEVKPSHGYSKEDVFEAFKAGYYYPTVDDSKVERCFNVWHNNELTPKPSSWVSVEDRLPENS